MAHINTNAPWRAAERRAKIWRIFANQCSAAFGKIAPFWRDPRAAYPRLTDRMARDAGIDPVDLEISRLQLPSQTQRHPML